jgi:hypothetical protein
VVNTELPNDEMIGSRKISAHPASSSGAVLIGSYRLSVAIENRPAFAWLTPKNDNPHAAAVKPALDGNSPALYHRDHAMAHGFVPPHLMFYAPFPPLLPV